MLCVEHELLDDIAQELVGDNGWSLAGIGVSGYACSLSEHDLVGICELGEDRGYVLRVGSCVEVVFGGVDEL